MLLVAVLVAALVGGGGERRGARTRRAASVRTRATASPTTTTTLPPVPMLPGGTPATGGTWTLTGQSATGYSARAEISLGPPQRLAAAGTTVTSSSRPPRPLRACSADVFVDAIIPARITVTNTTPNFPTVAGLRLARPYTRGSPLSLASDAEFTSGPDCTEVNGASSGVLYGVRSTNSLSPGSSLVDEVFIVVRDYYSPARPDGDIDALRLIALEVTLTFGPDGAVATTQQLTGPAGQTTPHLTLRSSLR